MTTRRSYQVLCKFQLATLATDHPQDRLTVAIESKIYNLFKSWTASRRKLKKQGNSFAISIRLGNFGL